MSYLVDTDYVVEYLKGRAPAVELLPILAQEGLAISLVTFGEIYEGIYFGTDPRAHERAFRRLLRFVDVLPLNRPILRRFARIRGDLRRRGMLIGDPDILIAATAIENGRRLVTHNRRHFERIPDLQLYEP